MSALELYSLKTELLHAIAEASDLDKLEEVRIAALGQQGPHLRADAGARLAAAGRAQSLRSGRQQPEGIHRRGARSEARESCRTRGDG